MKRHRINRPFLEMLMRRVRELKGMKPGDVHVISINARYGHYQIVIGPEKDEGVPRGKAHTRPIEINGEIHHLFISPHTVRAHPSRNEVMENLKHTVIMRDLSVHLVDPNGDGRHIDAPDGINARQFINLAGEEGEKMIERMCHSERLSLAAYKIIQKDILQSLSERREQRNQ